MILALGRLLLALIMIASGLLHLTIPQVYLRIMPPYLLWPLLLVYLSGIAEIVCGAGLLVPKTRHLAAWGLIALLIAVMPANIYMATAHLPAPGIFGESWAQWLRIPLQLPLIGWAYLYTRA